MKMRIFLTLALVVSFGVAAWGVSSPTLAADTQCSPSQSTVNVNEMVTLQASGGDGSFHWSGQNLTIDNPNASQLTVAYNTPGTYTVNVESNNQTDSCTVVVRSNSNTSGTLMCSPAVQAANVGQSVSFTASGGTGTYSWSSPDLTINNPSGSGFTATFSSSGTKTVTLRSGTNTSTCVVNVGTGAVLHEITPGFPNTGEM